MGVEINETHRSGNSVSDRSISLGCAAAVVLWLVVAALTAVSVEGRDVYLITAAGVVGLVAGTVTIRAFFVTQNQMLRSAFELGQDAARMEGRPEVSHMYPVR